MLIQKIWFITRLFQSCHPSIALSPFATLLSCAVLKMDGVLHELQEIKSSPTLLNGL